MYTVHVRFIQMQSINSTSTVLGTVQFIYSISCSKSYLDKCEVQKMLAKDIIQTIGTIIHWDLELAAHYAKFIPRVYFFHKKSRTISTVFLRNSTIMFKNKLCSCI